MTVTIVNDAASYRQLLASDVYAMVKSATCGDRFDKQSEITVHHFTPAMKAIAEQLFDDVSCIACLGRTFADIDIEKTMTREERVTFAQQAFLEIKGQASGNTPEEIERNAVAVFTAIVSNASKMRTQTGFQDYSIPRDALKGVLEFGKRSR